MFNKLQFPIQNLICLVTCTLGTRGYSRVRPEFSVLAEGRSRAGHYKDLTETGNRARKVSGTRGTLHVARPARNTCISSFCRSFTCHSEYIYLIKLVYSQFPTMHGSLYFWVKKLHPFTSFRVIKI